MSEKTHIQTPIFSRTRRASAVVKVSSEKENGNEKVNLRIVQLEVAQKEACNVLKTLCQDAATKLHINSTSYEIDDILSGILVLGNLYKRIGNEKLELEKEIESMKAQFEEYKRDKQKSIEHLEDVILKLQQENIKAQDTLTEVKLKHGQKLALAMKEISNSREALEIAQQDYIKLEAKMHSQERKLMEMPRMEEQYIRNARSIVRQQEVANSFKEIGWKKLEEEVKSLNFWKNKAKMQEDIMSKQKLQIEQLANQSRANLSKYQSLLQESKNKHSSKSQGKVRENQRKGVAFNEVKDENADCNKSKSKYRRPASAGSHIGKADNIFGSGTYDRNKAELEKLRSAVAKKDEHITRLTRQLCYVRARPLMGMLDDGEAADTMVQFLKNRHQQQAHQHDDDAVTYSNSNKAGMKRSQTYGGLGSNSNLFGGSIPVRSENVGIGGEEERMSLEELYQYYPDDDSQTDSFIAEEKRREEARIQEAISIQQDFNGRIETKRASTAPHIAAIRKARSFAPGIATQSS